MRGVPDHLRRWIAPALLILATALVAHGLLLLDDAVFWDGWLEVAALKTRNQAALQLWFDDQGLPHIGWFHRAVLHLSHPALKYRWIGFGGWLVFALCASVLARRHARLTHLEAGLMGALMVAHRAATSCVSLINVPYFLCVGLFGLASLALFGSLEGSWRRRGLLRVLAAVGFVAAFATQSLLVLAGPVVAAVVVLGRRRDLPWLPALLRSGLSRLDVASMVPLSYFGLKALSPKGHVYAHYNELHLEVDHAGLVDSFVEYGVLRPITDGGVLLPAGWLSLVAMATVLLAAWPVQDVSPRPWGERGRALGVVAFGVVVLAAAIAPYVLVNKVPVAGGWSWRLAVVAPLGMALTGAALARLGRTWRPLIGAGVAALLVVALCGEVKSSVDAHLRWLARAAKERGIVMNLRERRQPRGVSVIWVKEQWPRINDEKVYNYEYMGLFLAAWKTWQVAGFAEDKRPFTASRIQSLRYYGMPGINLDGKHMRMQVERVVDDNTTLESIGARYLTMRWMQGRTAADAWARTIAPVTLTPIAPPKRWTRAVKIIKAADARGDKSGPAADP